MTNNFDSDEAREAYIEQLIIETEQLEVKAKSAKAFTEMYESANFKTVILDGLLIEHAKSRSAILVDPSITDELEGDIQFELKTLRYLNRYLAHMNTKSLDAERLVRDNKQLLLDIQSGKEDR